MDTYNSELTGQRLGKIIDEEGITKKKACELIGIQAGSLNGYLKGKHGIPPHVLYTISSLTGVSVDYLLGIIDKDDRYEED